MIKRVASYYHSLAGRPTPLLTLNLPAESALHLIDIYHLYLDWVPAIPLACLSYQASLQLISRIVQRQSFKKPALRWTEKLLDRVVKMDLERDISFFEIEKAKADRLRARAGSSYHMGMFIKLALNICWFRGLRFMVDNPAQFLHLQESSLFGLNLLEYDPYFIAPLLTGFLLMLITRTSLHPWGLVLKRKENWYVRLNLGLGVAMVSAGFPVCYHMSLWVMLSWRVVWNWVGV